MVSKEETEAIWEELRKLRQEMLAVAKASATLHIRSTYYSCLTMLGLMKRIRGMNSFSKYMEPRADSAVNDILRSDASDQISEIALEFFKDCIDYLESLMK
mgnify:FL=1